ncbi:MAG: hypothetical protein FWH27_16245, partial [Planctomycetaceae bacterium]|nr:hypothetical protein [Planctomycetaceae bacterium]
QVVWNRNESSADARIPDSHEHPQIDFAVAVLCTGDADAQLLDLVELVCVTENDRRQQTRDDYISFRDLLLRLDQSLEIDLAKPDPTR